MNSKNNKMVLIILSAICLILIATSTIKDNWLSPLRTGVGYILMPIQSGVNTVGMALYNDAENNRKLKSALDDNKLLQAKIDALVTENTSLEEDSFELQRLRKLYALDQEYGQYKTVGARIIAKDSIGWFSVFRIDKGSSDGIAVDMNVIAGGGLVGIVTDVGANYATVRSIIDDVSRVSGMAMQSGAGCIISGDIKLFEQGELRISDVMADTDIKDGDKIVTSNISSKYLPGILIGYAKDITTDNNRLTKSGYLVPVASFDTLQEVLIITETKQQETEGIE